jgi:hypothetical protein
MLVVKHITRDGDTELSSEYLAPAFDSPSDAEAAIAEAQKKFEHRGIDQEHARWWARNKTGPVHYWWWETK